MKSSNVQRKRNLIGAAVGSGITAQAAEQGQADFLLAINAGRMRSMGAPSIACMLPTHEANEMAWRFATSEILPVTELPVYLGISCWHPVHQEKDFISRILDAGFAGAVNFPTSMHYSDSLRKILDRAHLGTRKEIELLQQVQDAGGKSLFYCDTRNQARMGADAGLNGLVLNFGWNTGGSFGHTPKTSLEEVAFAARNISRFVKNNHPEMPVFLEGGPILTEADLRFVTHSAKIDGYVGGSTLDRLPIEQSIADQIARYRSAVRKKPVVSSTEKRLLRRANLSGLWGESEQFLLVLRELDQAIRANSHIILELDNGAPEGEILKFLEASVGTSSDLKILVHENGSGPRNSEFETSLFGLGTKKGLLSQEDALIWIQNTEGLSKTVIERFNKLFDTGRYKSLDQGSSQIAKLRLFLTVRPDHDKFNQAAEGKYARKIRYPRLSERFEDIPKLFEQSLSAAGAPKNTFRSLPPSVLQMLQSHDWPGNEAELSNIAIDIAGQFETKEVTLSWLKANLSQKSTSDSSKSRQQLDQRSQLLDVLARNGYRRTETAEALNISRKTLYNRMKRFNLM